MKGITFYLEYENKTEKNKATVKQPGNHRGTVLAVYNGQWVPANDGTKYEDRCIEATGAIQDYPNSPVCSTAASIGYLREKCKRIPERMVKEIHPTLYNYLKS